MSGDINISMFPGISGSTLKLIAIVTMFIDHLGATVLRAILKHPAVTGDSARLIFWQTIYGHSRSIGRLAFPIFCFLLAEGFCHTRNARKYAGRMFLFALLSEIPFDIALKGNWYFPGKQNVYFTLLIGLLVLMGISFAEKITGFETIFSSKNPSIPRKVLALLLFTVLTVCIIWAGMYVAKEIDTDYNYKGVFLIAMLYLTRRFRLHQCAVGAIAVAWEMPAPLGFLPVYFYNGTRGLSMKYFFYWFYPVHLLLLHLIADYVIPML